MLTINTICLVKPCDALSLMTVRHSVGKLDCMLDLNYRPMEAGLHFVNRAYVLNLWYSMSHEIIGGAGCER